MRSYTLPLLEILFFAAHIEQSMSFIVPTTSSSIETSFGLIEKSTTSTAMSMRKDNSDETKNTINRRNALFSVFNTATAAIVGSSSLPANAAGDDRLFKANPLMNPILEKIRILEQDEADNMKYGGELAPGSPKGREAYAKLLVPILDIQTDILKVKDLVMVKDGEGLNKANDILNKPQFEEFKFKKIFNAFGDNIYYSDPDRANAYLGGGAVPKNEQSIAYLLRNDILTNLENLQAEVAYLIKERKAGNELEIEDLYLYTDICKDGMVKYLELVPPAEIKIAKEIVASR